MGKAVGFLMILAGVGTAAYMVPSLDLKERPSERQVADAAVNAAAAKVSSSATATTEIAKPLPVVRPAAGPAPYAAPGLMPVQATPLTKPIEPVRVADATGARDGQRLALTKDIQRELQRVGCYAGAIDGEWSGQTRQAMKTFIERVNATLPIDAPDHILKTLVSGHPGDACSKSCPAGQSMANGRCLPSTVVAQAAPRKAGESQRSTPAAVPKVVRVPAASEPAQDTQRVAAAPPAPAPQQAVRPLAKEVPREAVVSSWTPTVVPAPMQPAPAAAKPAPITTAALPGSELANADAGGRPRAELPGRMAVGVGVTPASVAAAAPKPVTTEAPSAASDAVIAPKKASRIVIKPAPGGSKSSAPKATAAIPPTIAIPVKDAASSGAVAAVEQKQPPQQAATAPVAAQRVQEKQRPSARPAPERSIAVYRAPMPAPRYVGAYFAPQPTYRERVTFGPSIFKRMDRDSR